MPYPPPKPLLQFLKAYDPAVRKLALTIRDFVIPEMEPCIEYIYDAYSAVCFGYGPNDRYQDGAIHVAVYTSHVNLGFNEGAHMEDPAKLLKGTGKNVRHITIKSEDDLKRPEIRQYLRQARRMAADDLPYPKDLKGVISVVKAIYANKRRPNTKAAKA
jgi:Domain of unknown function (DU1801)